MFCGRKNIVICILMSTYNGAKYIKEQIDSILNQTISDFAIYIRDDGSTDDTYNIIEAIEDDRINLFRGGGKHWLQKKFYEVD